MDVRDIKKLVLQGENGTIEFKRKVRHPEKIVREIVAFANSSGGKLLIGVDDNGTIPGIKYFEDENFIMQNAIKELCRPGVDYETHIVKFSEDSAVLLYDIKESRNKPHFALLERNHHYGKAYIRINDRTVQASKELRTIMKYRNHHSSPGFSYGDNEKLLLSYLGKHEDITLKKYSDISALTQKRASEVLINLALNNVIEIIPGEGEDRYVFPH